MNATRAARPVAAPADAARAAPIPKGRPVAMHLAIVTVAAFLALFGVAARAGVESDGVPVILVAHPGISEPAFAETVIVVTFPPNAGPVGLVLNRPSGMTLGELFGQDRPELAQHRDPIYLGGPVAPASMLFLFRSRTPADRALPVAGDVYLSGDDTVFESLVARPDAIADRRFFAGHAGWADGQLDAEIDRGEWYVLPADADSLLARDTTRLWETLLARATALRARLAPGNRGGSGMSVAATAVR
ncbi:MAG: hypothetical protein GC151_11405 [Betaproteobacteria bacterium]|nr:hypothetical protein [Betaproteobacteria bacterium]